MSKSTNKVGCGGRTINDFFDGDHFLSDEHMQWAANVVFENSEELTKQLKDIETMHELNNSTEMRPPEAKCGNNRGLNAMAYPCKTCLG